MSPDRVRNVPKIVRKNVASNSETFQTFNDPRRSWIMVECKNAVIVNHGMHAAFSTGSHAQNPPIRVLRTPRASERVPDGKNSHANNAHRRTA